MPLNMNTVGTGTGIGGQQSASADFMFKMNDFISSRINSVDMNTFDVSLDPLYDVYNSTGSDYHINSQYWPECAYPLIKYNDELYVYASHSAVDLDNTTINKDILYKAILQPDGTMTRTQISIPFVHIQYAFIFSDYLYLFCDDTYNSSNNISSIYKYDGKTFTKLSAAGPIKNIMNVCRKYNSRCISRGIRVTPIINTDSNDCIIIVGVLQYDSDSYTDNNYIAIAIWKLSKDGIITEVLNPNKIKYDYNVVTFSDSEIKYTSTRRSGVIGKTLLGLCKQSGTPTNIDTFGNVCTSYEYNYDTKDHIIHLGNIFVENSDTTYNPKTIGVKLCKLILTMKYDSKTDTYSYQTTLTDNTLLQNFQNSYSSYELNRSSWFPLSYKKPDTFIVLLHNGYHADYGQGSVSTTPTTLKIWLVKIRSDDIIFKQLKFNHNEYELFSSSMVTNYTVSEYSLLDFDYHIPAFHIFSSYYDGGVRYYTYRILKINTSDMKYSSDDSRYTISMYLNAGDTCRCNCGIVDVDYNNSTISVNSTKYVIPQNGKYTFTCKVHDAYKRPGFIVQSKDGCILNLRIKYDDVNGCVTGYFQKGMTVNGVTVQDDGYTSVSVESPRINITM